MMAKDEDGFFGSSLRAPTPPGGAADSAKPSTASVPHAAGKPKEAASGERLKRIESRFIKLFTLAVHKQQMNKLATTSKWEAERLRTKRARYLQFWKYAALFRLRGLRASQIRAFRSTYASLTNQKSVNNWSGLVQRKIEHVLRNSVHSDSSWVLPDASVQDLETPPPSPPKVQGDGEPSVVQPAPIQRFPNTVGTPGDAGAAWLEAHDERPERPSVAPPLEAYDMAQDETADGPATTIAMEILRNQQGKAQVGIVVFDDGTRNVVPPMPTRKHLVARDGPPKSYLAHNGKHLACMGITKEGFQCGNCRTNTLHCNQGDHRCQPIVLRQDDQVLIWDNKTKTVVCNRELTAQCVEAHDLMVNVALFPDTDDVSIVGTIAEQLHVRNRKRWVDSGLDLADYDKLREERRMQVLVKAQVSVAAAPSAAPTTIEQIVAPALAKERAATFDIGAIGIAPAAPEPRVALLPPPGLQQGTQNTAANRDHDPGAQDLNTDQSGVGPPWPANKDAVLNPEVNDNVPTDFLDHEPDEPPLAYEFGDQEWVNVPGTVAWYNYHSLHNDDELTWDQFGWIRLAFSRFHKRSVESVTVREVRDSSAGLLGWLSWYLENNVWAEEAGPGGRASNDVGLRLEHAEAERPAGRDETADEDENAQRRKRGRERRRESSVAPGTPALEEPVNVPERLTGAGFHQHVDGVCMDPSFHAQARAPTTLRCFGCLAEAEGAVPGDESNPAHHKDCKQHDIQTQSIEHIVACGLCREQVLASEDANFIKYLNWHLRRFAVPPAKQLASDKLPKPRRSSVAPAQDVHLPDGPPPDDDGGGYDEDGMRDVKG